jgi:hypothetical protein
MNSQNYQFYRHSGKFGPHGPALAIVLAIVAGFPLGYAYAYLIKWIPFIYLNFLITAGYSVALGFLAGLAMKLGKVRNSAVAALSGLIGGVIGLYLAWNGHIHSIFEGAPVLCTPDQMLNGMSHLYENGSWGLRSGGAVTGIPLAIVWAIEGLAIVGVSTFMSLGAVADTPFCERTGCWLDQEKKIEKLDAIVNPDHIATLRSGDISPLAQAHPRVPASGQFARLTVKHSPRCDDFCTLTIANVTVSVDKDGNPQEKEEKIVNNLIMPKTMLDSLSGSAQPAAARTAEA